MANVYHRDDEGGLVLTYSVTAGLNGWQAFKTILKACLVSGYGSKAPAGWELIGEGTNYLVLRNGSHSGYVCFTQHSTGHATVYLAETYTGMSGDVMTGDGLKTGLSASNGIPHRFIAANIATYAATTSWYMVADAKSFILQCTSNGTTASAPSISVTGMAHTPGLYVGEDSAGNFIAMGCENTTSTSSVRPRFDAGGFTALKNPNTGLLVGTGSLAVVTPGLAELAYTGAVVMSLQRAYLVPAVWLAAGIEAGRLRGLAMSPHFTGSTGGHVAAALGASNGLTTRTANTPINLGDGYTYFVSVQVGTPFLLTNNPEFW